MPSFGPESFSGRLLFFFFLKLRLVPIEITSDPVLGRGFGNFDVRFPRPRHRLALEFSHLYTETTSSRGSIGYIYSSELLFAAKLPAKVNSSTRVASGASDVLFGFLPSLLRALRHDKREGTARRTYGQTAWNPRLTTNDGLVCLSCRLLEALKVNQTVYYPPLLSYMAPSRSDYEAIGAE